MRKFRGDQIHVSYQLLYHMMVLLKGHTERSFELIIDLTQTTQHNEPDVFVHVHVPISHIHVCTCVMIF